MKRFQKIVKHEKYKKAYESIVVAEKNRKFCGHDMEHFLAVSRLAYIFVLEQDLNIEKDVVYAVGFLHDIGRCKEYEKGVSHEEASYQIAKDILPECGYTEVEVIEILQVIADHRNQHVVANPFSKLFYQADKMSRNCMECKAYDECYWSEEKKNHEYLY